jgi:hypothetical protein
MGSDVACAPVPLDFKARRFHAWWRTKFMKTSVNTRFGGLCLISNVQVQPQPPEREVN